MERTQHHYSPIVIWPFVLIGVGIVVLLVNTGAITWDSIGRIAGLWPILLILVGIELIVSRTAPRLIAIPVNIGISAVALLAVLLLAVSGAAWPIGSWWPAASTQTMVASAALPDAAHARLEINYGAAQLNIHSGSLGADLYRANVTYAGSPAPSVWLDRANGTVHVDRGNRSPFVFMPAGKHEQVDLVLSESIPWVINVNAGASQQTLDLRALKLASVQMNSGATSLELDLPSPTGTVPLKINGGAMSARLALPTGAAVELISSGGFNSLNVDGRQLSGIGEQSWQSPGYAQAGDRFDIDFSGGASSVRLERY
jgi:hypothetical protein